MRHKYKITLSFLMSILMMLGMAFASGTVTSITGGSGATTYVNYSFDVDGNIVDTNSDSGNSSHHGKTSTRGFSNSSTYVTFTFSGAYNSGATVVVYSENTHSVEGTFVIPLHQSGMGTLTYTMTLPSGQHYIKIVSKTYITYSTGSVKVSGISGYYYHSI